MQVMYARDDATRRITVTTSGPVTLVDILSNIDRQVTEGTWTYAVLYDTGEAGSLPTLEEIDRVIDRVRMAAARLGRRGPVAIVSRRRQAATGRPPPASHRHQCAVRAVPRGCLPDARGQDVCSIAATFRGESRLLCRTMQAAP